MFDIVAAHQHELTLAIEIKGIDHAKARLSRPPRPGRPHATDEDGTHDQQKRKKQNNDDTRTQNISGIGAEFVEQGLHRTVHLRAGRPAIEGR